MVFGWDRAWVMGSAPGGGGSSRISRVRSEALACVVVQYGEGTGLTFLGSNPRIGVELQRG